MLLSKTYKIMTEENKSINNCSFCGKSKDSVKKLVVGDNVSICSDCIELCQDLIIDDTDIVTDTESDTEVVYDPESEIGRAHV